MPEREKPRRLYCHTHNEWKVKNAGGTFVCVLCMTDQSKRY